MTVVVDSIIGGRSYQEDRYSHDIFTNCEIFGVYDGHAGHRVSEYISKNLPSLIAQRIRDLDDPYQAWNVGPAIEQAFIDMDQYICDNVNLFGKDGSCACICVIVGSFIYFCNLGDSRAVMLADGMVEHETDDHKPGSTDETMRIRAVGGTVEYSDTYRVNGYLSVSRAFGDREHKYSYNGQYMGASAPVSAGVDITVKHIDDCDYIVIGSDGVWDVLGSKDVLPHINDIINSIPMSIINDASMKGSRDNITCLVYMVDRN